MKIVLVVDQFDDGNNGTTVTTRRFASELRKRGHTVIVLAGGEPGENKVAAPIHRIPFFQGLIESQGMKFAKPDDEAYYQAFKDADIIHFFLPFRFCRRGEEIARQMRIPTMAAFHMQPENITYSIGLGRRSSINRFLYWWCYHVFYNRFNTIHCPSRFIASQLEKHHYDARLCVISNGVDEAFVPQSVERPQEWRDRFVVLMIGRLSGEKRQDLIIQAAKSSKYKDRIQLVFAGKGPMKKRYVKQSRGLPLSPVFGFYSQEELIRLINSCDLYVHASDAEIEGISCMEAFACGLVPVISDSELSATHQFALDDRSLFKAGDAKSLAERLDYWIEHPEERRRMSKVYAASGDAMRVEKCVQQAEEMYRDAIEDYRKNGYKKPLATHIHRITHPNIDKTRFRFCPEAPFKRFLLSAFTNVLTPILYGIDWAFFGLSVQGREHLRSLSGGAVTVLNHVHPMDCTMAKIATFPRRIYFTSLRQNLQLPFTGYLIRLCGGIPIPDSAARMLSFQKETEAALRRGDLVHYYPEGMLVRYHRGLREFRRGAFFTAVNTGLPVLPMAIVYRKPQGLRALLQKKRPYMCIRIGEPQYPDVSLKRNDSIMELMQRTRKLMAELILDPPSDNQRQNLPEEDFAKVISL